MGKIQRINKRVLPLMVAFGIVLSVVFGSYDTARATGIEELFYYTYFDLISGLFAETGQQFSLKDEFYTKPDRASGKQVWNNFCTWVENKAKTLALPVEVVNKTVFDELKDLPNKVTSAGATMSEKLSELLAKVLSTFSSADGLTDYGDRDTTYAFIRSVMGITDEYRWAGGTYSMYDVWVDLKNGSDLNVVKYGDFMLMFTTTSYYKYLKIQSGPWGYAIYYSTDGKSYSMYRHTGFTANSASLETSSQDLDSISSIEPVWIMKQGKFTVSDGSALKDYAKVKTVDDNTVYVPGVGWKTEWEVWNDVLDGQGATDKEKEEWWMRYHVNELLKDLPDSGDVDPDDEKRRKKDNEKDKLPVAIPIIPIKKPDSSDKDKDKDKDKDTEQSTEKTSVSPIVNPETGNVIDPDTGYDIDPNTGKLIDPDTGQLIDRDMSNTSDKLSKYGDVRKIFPFCIPFDIVDLIRGLRAEKAPPVFHYEHYFKVIDYTFTVNVDLSDYDKYIKLFRGGMIIFFIFALMWLTVKVSEFFS